MLVSGSGLCHPGEGLELKEKRGLDSPQSQSCLHSYQAIRILNFEQLN